MAQAVKYVRALNEAGPSTGPWPLVQEGITPPGLVMIVKAQPAQDPDRVCPISKLQVWRCSSSSLHCSVLHSLPQSPIV